MSRYTIENPTAVNKLVLIAPQWTRDTPSLADAGGLEGREILPLMLMAPNGTVIDSREYWAAGKPLYKPERITVPVLIVHGECDRDCPIEMSRAVFGKLTAAPYRRWVEIGEGTHSLFMKKNRWQLFGAVDQFLSESGPGEASPQAAEAR